VNGLPEGLRIGELAELGGVSTRAVRHYHRIGLLPEPSRQANGYRRYGPRDVVRLLRVRRLVELGLSLDEAADALGDDEGRELRDILVDLDADLARQEQRIAGRRAQIAGLLEREGDLAGSPEVGRLLGELDRVAPGHPGLVRERLVVEMLESASGELAPQFFDGYHRVLADPEVSEAALDAYRRFEELTGADPDDTEVERLAAEVISLGPAILTLLPQEVSSSGAAATSSAGAELVLRALRADMAPAQQRCFELILAGLTDRP